MVRRNAFTLIELLVVMAIILLLVGIIVPALTPVMELARRQKCGTNLKTLVSNMRVYAGSNDQFYPSAYDDDSPDASKLKILGSNNVGVDRLLATPLAGHSGPSRSLYLMVRNKYTTNLDVYICPSTENISGPVDGTGKAVVNQTLDYDFVSGQQLSYSYQSNKNGGAGRYWPVSTSSDPGLIVLADRSPIAGTAGDDPNSWASTPAATAYQTWTPLAAPGVDTHGGLDKFDKNSYNHGLSSQTGYGEGQNVVDIGSAARWTTTPNCGGRLWTSAGSPVGDNIWTWGDVNTGVPQTGAAGAVPFVDASPTASGDSYLR